MIHTAIVQSVGVCWIVLGMTRPTPRFSDRTLEFSIMIVHWAGAEAVIVQPVGAAAVAEIAEGRSALPRDVIVIAGRRARADLNLPELGSKHS